MHNQLVQRNSPMTCCELHPEPGYVLSLVLCDLHTTIAIVAYIVYNREQVPI